MKEMPGAPALPEGWFYRVTSRPFARTAVTYKVTVHRPILGGLFTRPVGSADVEGRYGFAHFDRNEKPTVDQLAQAARAAMGMGAGVEGDYR